MDNCPDCQAPTGALHGEDCDVARCAHTGIQRLQCGHEDCNTVWTGQWPGEAECAEYDWWAVMQPGVGWTPCTADTPGAEPDLNRLANPAHARWDRALRRYIKV
jgi:hypothetical protein